MVAAALEVPDPLPGQRLPEGGDDEPAHERPALHHPPARRGQGRVQEAARRVHDLDGVERAVVHGGVGVQAGLDDARHRVERHRRPHVGRPPGLRRGAGEVGGEAVARDGEGETAAERVRAVAVAVEIALGVVRPVRDPRDAGAHHLLGARDQLLDGGEQRLAAEAGEQPPEVLHRLARRAQHGVEVPAALAGDAHVLEEEGEPSVVHPPAIADPGGHDAKPLLVDLPDAAREAARGHAPDVPPVAAGRGEHREPPFVEHRVEHQHVVEVGAAGVGVVVEEDVALVDVPAERAHHLRRRVRDREVVDGVVVPPLRDEAAVGRDERAREVVALVDDRRVRRVDDVRAHLVDHRDQGLPDQLEPAQLSSHPPSSLLPFCLSSVRRSAGAPRRGRRRGRHALSLHTPGPIPGSIPGPFLPVRAGLTRSGPGRTRPDPVGPGRTEPSQTGPEAPGPSRTGPGRTRRTDERGRSAR